MSSSTGFRPTAQFATLMTRIAQVIDHQEQVATITIAIFDPVRYQCFHMKPLPLK